MFDFNQEPFHPLREYNSNEDDMEIFRHCHIVVPSGKIPLIHVRDEEANTCFCLFLEHCVEICGGKASSWASKQVVEVPVLCEFDIWKPYDLPLTSTILTILAI